MGNRKLKTVSGGMKRRLGLGIARALRPAPRQVSRTHIRLISPTLAPMVCTPPQATTCPLLTARTSSPAGGGQRLGVAAVEPALVEIGAAAQIGWVGREACVPFADHVAISGCCDTEIMAAVRTSVVSVR